MGGGVDWFTDYADTHSRQSHHLITWYLRRLKLCERLEYATITLHIISYNPNRVVVEDTVFSVQYKTYAEKRHT